MSGRRHRFLDAWLAFIFVVLIIEMLISIAWMAREAMAAHA